mgnify:FL=1
MKNHYLRSIAFAAMAALMLASTGCKKDDNKDPEPENLASKFDAGFAAALQAKGIIKDAKNITADEIAGVKSIDVSGTESAKGSLTSLNGIELFKALTTLKCNFNSLTSLDLTSNTELTELNCQDNKLRQIKIDGLAKLKKFYFGNNQVLLDIDISSCVALETITFPNCGIETIDVSKNPNLTMINAYFNNLESIDISKNLKLTSLRVSDNPGVGDDLEGIFYVYVPKDFDVNVPPTNFTQEGWWYQTRKVEICYQHK